MRLTKKTRSEIYKKALRRLRIGSYSGLCSVIFTVLAYDLNIDFDEADRVRLRNFPELYKKKPEKLYGVGYWFKPDVKAPRIRILKEAIKELEKLK